MIPESVITMPGITDHDPGIGDHVKSESVITIVRNTQTRQARQRGDKDPVFTDHFSDYKEALSNILPHVVFTGVNSKARTLLFDTTGLELSFDQLSGGEREIAFLIGQIDRFGLRQGRGPPPLQRALPVDPWDPGSALHRLHCRGLPQRPPRHLSSPPLRSQAVDSVRTYAQCPSGPCGMDTVPAD